MRAAGPSVPEPVSARALVPADTRTVAQKQADTLLRRCRIDRATVAQLGGNIVELAQRLGEDTRLVLSALNDRTRDAVIAAKFIWGSVGRWFGEPDRVRSAKASLHAGDHDRIGRLTNWLGALELIERHMAPLEADMLKRDRYPKAKHLEKAAAGKGDRVRRRTGPVASHGGRQCGGHPVRDAHPVQAAVQSGSGGTVVCALAYEQAGHRAGAAHPGVRGFHGGPPQNGPRQEQGRAMGGCDARAGLHRGQGAPCRHRRSVAAQTVCAGSETAQAEQGGVRPAG